MPKRTLAYDFLSGDFMGALNLDTDFTEFAHFHDTGIDLSTASDIGMDYTKYIAGQKGFGFESYIDYGKPPKAFNLYGKEPKEAKKYRTVGPEYEELYGLESIAYAGEKSTENIGKAAKQIKKNIRSYKNKKKLQKEFAKLQKEYDKKKEFKKTELQIEGIGYSDSIIPENKFKKKNGGKKRKKESENFAKFARHASDEDLT